VSEILHSEGTLVVIGIIFLVLGFITLGMCANGKIHGYRVTAVIATLVMGFFCYVSILQKITPLIRASGGMIFLCLVGISIFWKNPDIRIDKTKTSFWR